MLLHGKITEQVDNLDLKLNYKWYWIEKMFFLQMISMGTKRLFCSSFHHVGSKMVDSKIIMNQVQEYNIYNKYMVISESFIWL